MSSISLREWDGLSARAVVGAGKSRQCSLLDLEYVVLQQLTCPLPVQESPFFDATEGPFGSGRGVPPKQVVQVMLCAGLRQSAEVVLGLADEPLFLRTSFSSSTA